MKSGHGSFSTGMKGKREGGFKGQKKHSADGQKSTTSVVNFGKQNINGKSLKVHLSKDYTLEWQFLTSF